MTSFSMRNSRIGFCAAALPPSAISIQRMSMNLNRAMLLQAMRTGRGCLGGRRRACDLNFECDSFLRPAAGSIRFGDPEVD